MTITREPDMNKKTSNRDKSKDKTYRCWINMRQRCNNKNHACYKTYGGRGIFVCHSWNESFDSFLSDMGESPSEMVLDRINNNDGYYKGNCRWANKSVSVFNRGMPTNSSGERGVYFDRDKNKHYSLIKKNGKFHCLGYFKSLKEAKTAYNNKALELFGFIPTSKEDISDI